VCAIVNLRMGLAARSKERRKRLQVRLLLTAIVFVGLALRYWSPAMRSDLWYDETFSLTIAGQPFSKMLHSFLLGADANPPLYTLLLHFWLKLGESDVHIKLLSLMFGVAVIPTMYIVAREAGGRRVGLVASLLLATAPAAVNYSVEARSYSLFFFLSLLSTHFLLSIARASSGNDRKLFRLWIAYGALSALSVYAHWFGLLVLLVQTVAFAILYLRSFRLMRDLVLSLAAITMACTPLIPLFRNETALRNAAGGFLWPGRPDLHSIYELASFLFGGELLLPLAVVLMIIGFWKPGRRSKGDTHCAKREVLFFASYLILPVAVIFAISNLLSHFSFFVFRYFLPFIASVPILIAISLRNLRSSLAVGFLSIFVLFPAIKIFKHSPNTPYSHLAAELATEPSKYCVVAHLSPMSYYPALHYVKSEAPAEKVLCDASQPASFPLRIAIDGELLANSDLLSIDALSPKRDLLVVIDPIDKDKNAEALWNLLQKDDRYSVASEEQVAGLVLERLVARKPAEETDELKPRYEPSQVIKTEARRAVPTRFAEGPDLPSE